MFRKPRNVPEGPYLAGSEVQPVHSYYAKDIVILNPLSAKLIKWSNILKQIVGILPTICLSLFDHFSRLVLKGLTVVDSFLFGLNNKIKLVIFMFRVIFCP